MATTKAASTTQRPARLDVRAPAAPSPQTGSTPQPSLAPIVPGPGRRYTLHELAEWFDIPPETTRTDRDRAPSLVLERFGEKAAEFEIRA